MGARMAVSLVMATAAVAAQACTLMLCNKAVVFSFYVGECCRYQRTLSTSWTPTARGGMSPFWQPSKL